ncbi:FGGY family carbohydrate kinase [Brachyspira pilosicoli]|uniref:FGGY family carbohydrate kinase n=1 Tax=Brachyspira pilosicoli TaxID=52584 RepID=UPI0030055805
MNHLLIDFGASRVKTAIYQNNKIIAIKDYKPAEALIYNNIYYEVPVNKIIQLFYSIIKDYESYNIKSIFICSEQHGFVLKSNENFITEYISWKDNRAIELIDNTSTIEFIKNKLPNFKKHTGMNIKPGLPCINLLHMMRLGKIPKKIKIISLPEIFFSKKVHSTMIAGLGIWDIYKKEPYKELFDLYKSLGYEVTFNEPTYNVNITSNINNIDIYTGVGDTQCAIYGANITENDIILNMGTGSQIAKIDTLNIEALMEQRPYFNNLNLSIITHIPSGRALNCYTGFIDECIKIGNSKISVWDLLSKFTVKDLINSDINIDLAVFDSAYNFKNGGCINNITEYNFNINNYLSSLLRSYIEQYLNIIDTFNLKNTSILLSGGIPKKLNIIYKYIKEKRKEYDIRINTSEADDSLNGLLKLINQI